MKNFSISTFRPEFLPAFVALNRDWIETYFKIEEMDIRQLEDPFSSILDVGGEIFFVLESGTPVGVCAMIPHGEKSYELAKMAVSRSSRGEGIGDLLMKVALEWARGKGAESVTLLSNTVLEPATNLYKKHGFSVVRLGDHPDYARCNIEMIYMNRPPKADTSS